MRQPPRMTREPARLTIPPPPSAWRGPTARLERPAPTVRKPCGLCNRVRALVGFKPR
jgi:hypothetical protein